MCGSLCRSICRCLCRSICRCLCRSVCGSLCRSVCRSLTGIGVGFVEVYAHTGLQSFLIDDLGNVLVGGDQSLDLGLDGGCAALESLVVGNDELALIAVEDIAVADVGLGCVEFDSAVISSSYNVVAEDREHSCLVYDDVISAGYSVGQLESSGVICLITVDVGGFTVGNGTGDIEHGVYGEGLAYVNGLLNVGAVGSLDGHNQSRGLGGGLCRSGCGLVCGSLSGSLGRSCGGLSGCSAGLCEGRVHRIAHAGLCDTAEYDLGGVFVGSSQNDDAVANGSKAVCLYLIGSCDELRIICIEAEAVVDIGGGSAVLDDAGGLGVGQSAGTEYGEYLCCIGNLALGVNSVVELEN